MRVIHRNGDVSSVRHQQNGEFRRLLAKSGLSQADLAKMTDTHPNTVSRWAAGKSKAPGGVLAYLRLYADVSEIIDRT